MEVFINLTINGLATGMLLFLMASGISLIFGLMGVLNFGHGAIFMWGVYTATWTYSITDNFFIAILSGFFVGGAIGIVTERLLIRPVYNNPMGQVLITLGLMIILNELVMVVWGPNVIQSPAPTWLTGVISLGDITVSRYRIFIIVIALLVTLVVQLILSKTKIGMIVRAGVENAELIEALGVNIKQVFSLVFIFGAALASLGGAMIGPFQGMIGPSISVQYMLLGFIVVIIGGLGSFIGTLVAGVVVGLANNYVAWTFPDAVMAVNVLLMIIVLMWRPRGLFGDGGKV